LKEVGLGFYTPLPLRRSSLASGLLVVMQPAKRLTFGWVVRITTQPNQLDHWGNVVSISYFPPAAFNGASGIVFFKPMRKRPPSGGLITRPTLPYPTRIKGFMSGQPWPMYAAFSHNTQMWLKSIKI